MKYRWVLTSARLVSFAAVTVMVLSPVTSLSSRALSAQAETPAKDKSTNAEPKKASVRISVVLADPSRELEARPVEGATVKIRGEEESYETDEEGNTRILIMSPGQKAIVIRPSGADPCNVDVAIKIKEGAQIVTVFVELSPKIKCTLEP